MTNVTVASYNTYKDLDGEVFKQDLWALTHTTAADLVGLQEVHGAGRSAALAAAPPTWGVFRDTDGARRQTPVLWRTSVFEFVEGGVHFMAAGKLTLPDRWATWVELVHKPTQHTVYLINSHAHPHIEKAGHPRTYLPRTHEAFKHFDRLADLTTRLSHHGMVFVTGDFNIDYRADRRVKHPGFPAATFPTARLVPCWRWAEPPRGTHKGGNRVIDYVAASRHSHLVPVAAKALTDGYHSDHLPVLATYTIT